MYPIRQRRRNAQIPDENNANNIDNIDNIIIRNIELTYQHLHSNEVTKIE